jgi:hypothetical protein
MRCSRVTPTALREMSVARATMSSMSIDKELLRSLSHHPATGPRLVEYVVTGKWAKPKAGAESLSLPTDETGFPGG